MEPYKLHVVEAAASSLSGYFEEDVNLRKFMHMSITHVEQTYGTEGDIARGALHCARHLVTEYRLDADKVVDFLFNRSYQDVLELCAFFDYIVSTMRHVPRYGRFDVVSSKIDLIKFVVRKGFMPTSRTHVFALAVENERVSSWGEMLGYRDVRSNVSKVIARCIVRLLWLHTRACKTANAPDRKRKRGEFVVDD